MNFFLFTFDRLTKKETAPADPETFRLEFRSDEVVMEVHVTSDDDICCLLIIQKEQVEHYF